MNRRRFLLAALAAPQALAGLASAQAERQRAYDRDFMGFATLSDAEFYELVAGYAETPIRLTETESEEDGRRTFAFSLPAASEVFLSATIEGADQLFVHPLIVHLANGRRYLLPAIRSSEKGRRLTTAAQLGRCDAGTHAITVTQDRSAALPLPSSLQLQATRPNPESLLGKFMNSQPVVKLKNPDNVLDDIPLMAFSQIHRRGDVYRVTSSIIFSSENGGTKPFYLMASFGRTVDIEWVMQQLFEATGDVIRTRRRFQAKGHESEQFAGRETIGSNPVLATATANNLFSDGKIRLWRWTMSNPFAEEVADPIYYSPKPLFLPPLAGGGDLLHLYPELQQWSLFELAMEGCVTVANPDDPESAAFLADLDAIRQHVRTTYRDRRCGRKVGVQSTRRD